MVMVTSVKEISGCSRLHSPPKSPKYFNYSCSVICFQTWSNCFVCDLYKSPLSGKTFTLSWVWDIFLLVNVSTLVSTSSCQWLCVTAVWQQPVIYPQEQTNGLPSVVSRNLHAPEEGELASKGAVIGREGMFACERWSLDVLRHKRLLETRLTAEMYECPPRQLLSTEKQTATFGLVFLPRHSTKSWQASKVQTWQGPPAAQETPAKQLQHCCAESETNRDM